MKIGIDLDNTIIDYTELFQTLALEASYLTDSAGFSKQQIRDTLRSRGQELDWQKLQSRAYGSDIMRARLYEGIHEFLGHCADKQIEVCLVSHKTRFPAQEPRLDLRAAAVQFLESHSLLSDSAIPRANLYFEDTRTDKVGRLVTLQCTTVIDDLTEVFEHPNFPDQVRCLLFDPLETARTDPRWVAIRSWGEATRMLFQENT